MLKFLSSSLCIFLFPRKRALPFSILRISFLEFFCTSFVQILFLKQFGYFGRREMVRNRTFVQLFDFLLLFKVMISTPCTLRVQHDDSLAEKESVKQMNIFLYLKQDNPTEKNLTIKFQVPSSTMKKAVKKNYIFDFFLQCASHQKLYGMKCLFVP